MTTQTTQPDDYARSIEDALAFIAETLTRYPEWVTDFGESADPHLGKRASRYFYEHFGISLRAGTTRREEKLVTPPDGTEPFWEFSVEAEWVDRNGLIYTARGSCGTDERFVAGKKRDGTRIRDWGSIRNAARAFAETRMVNAAIGAAAGLDLITWDDLMRAGFPRDRALKAYKDGGSGGGGGGGAGRNNGSHAPNNASASAGGKLPPRGDMSARGYVWKTYKNEWEGCGETWKWVGDATKALWNTYWKVADLSSATEEQFEAIAAKLEELHAAPAATSQAGGQPAATAEQKALYAEITKLGDMLNIDKSGQRALVEKHNGGPLRGHPAVPILQAVVRELEARTGGTPPDDSPLGDDDLPF